MMISNILLVHILYLALCVFAAANDNNTYVPTTYKALGLLNRTSEVGIDTVNPLRCINNIAGPGDERVGMALQSRLVIICDADALRRETVRLAFKQCMSVIGFGIRATYCAGQVTGTDVNVLGSLNNMLAVENISGLSGVNRFIPPMSINTSAT